MGHYPLQFFTNEAKFGSLHPSQVLGKKVFSCLGAVINKSGVSGTLTFFYSFNLDTYRVKILVKSGLLHFNDLLVTYIFLFHLLKVISFQIY